MQFGHQPVWKNALACQRKLTFDFKWITTIAERLAAFGTDSEQSHKGIQ
jgi:hypothetical protein